jgi:hypothetical protein
MDAGGLGPAMKIIFCAVVWGDLHSRLFLEFCLQSLMHPSNLYSIEGRAELLILTDPATSKYFAGEHRDGRIRALEAWLPIRVESLPQNVRPDQSPYPVQANAHRRAMQYALEKGAAVSFLVPDGVVANGFCLSLLRKLDLGYRAVCGLSMRATLETAIEAIRAEDGLLVSGLPNRTLVRIALEHMHPLFLTSYWNAPRFNKMPYTMLWGDETQLIARTFALHPYLVVPTEESATFQGTADSDLPGYYSPEETCVITDSDELLVCELALANHFAPAFGPGPASVQGVAEWAKGAVHASQWRNLGHRFWFHTDDAPPLSGWRAADEMIVRQIAH